MADRQSSFALRALRGLWKVINGTRLVILNLVFFLILLIVLGASLRETAPVIEQRTTLVLDPAGVVVEQYASDPVERALEEALGQPRLETLFRDLLAALERAREDERITQVVLELDALTGIGPAQLEELGRAIATFRQSGKPVLAWTEGMLQQQYYLAAAADEIWMHPEGLVLVEGFGVFRNYYKALLEKLDVSIHLFRVGEYKSAAEPFVRNDMSAESREANRYWLGGLWEAFLADLAGFRSLTVDELLAVVENPAERLSAAEGSMARMAIEQGLVDEIATRDEFVARVLENGAPTRDGESFRSIGFERYLQGTSPLSPVPDKVAIVVAQGPIMAGEQPPGTVGGDTVVSQIRKARADPRVGALVLRVDSPGGAVLPSEKIRAELADARDDGLPVVVSMGAVAASGGYWISLGAEEILAERTTITGSIGIFGMVTTIPDTLARIGVYTDGVGTAPLAGAFRIDRPLDPEAAALIQLVIEDGYEDFITTVASARDMDPAAVDRIARGRVWTGQQALERGLVDRIGGLADAVARAGELAGLERYGVLYFEEKPTPFEQFLLEMSNAALAPLARLVAPRDLARRALGHPVLGDLATVAGTQLGELPPELRFLFAQRAGRLGAYAYCFCRP